MVKPTVEQALGVPGALLGQAPCAVHPQLCIPFIQTLPGPSVVLPQALGSDRQFLAGLGGAWSRAGL